MKARDSCSAGAWMFNERLNFSPKFQRARRAAESEGKPSSYMSSDTIFIRHRIVCTRCKRRLWADFRLLNCGCCIQFRVPPHKRKGWWKRGKARKRKGDRRVRRGL